MTAIVSVLNKHAVAIAADSAVTIGGSKVMNTANKLFALSKYHPVAIAVYGNAELIGTPWEIIIKEYRKQVKKRHFGSLQEYADDFIKFLSRKHYYCDDAEALNNLKARVIDMTNTIVEIFNNDPALIDNYLTNLDKKYSKSPLNPGFTQSTVDFFTNNLGNEISKSIDILHKSGVTKSDAELSDVITSSFTKNISPFSYTGLVFFGYGTNEIFPSVCHYKFGCVINGLLAQKQIKVPTVSKSIPSAICPFAQTDVMHTILRGIAPQIQKIYMDSLGQVFDKFKEELAKIIEPKDNHLASQVKALDMTPLSVLYSDLCQQAQRVGYIAPFVDSVASLEKEDLADFAESLITLTSLKRKVSPEQETVGGPVDVMVISKGDGIIWMKRKHYFQPDLNHHFFDNYFNN